MCFFSSFSGVAVLACLAVLAQGCKNSSANRSANDAAGKSTTVAASANKPAQPVQTEREKLLIQTMKDPKSLSIRAAAELSMLAKTSRAARTSLIANLFAQQNTFVAILWEPVARNCEAGWIPELQSQYTSVPGENKLGTLLYLLGSMGQNASSAIGFLNAQLVLPATTPAEAAAMRVVLAEIGDRSKENIAAIEKELSHGSDASQATVICLMAFGRDWCTAEMIRGMVWLLGKNQDADIYLILALGNQNGKADGAIGVVSDRLRTAEATLHSGDGGDVPSVFACRLALAQMDSKQQELHLSKAMEVIGSDKFSDHPHAAAVWAAQRQLGHLRASILQMLDSKNQDVQTGVAFSLAVIGAPQKQLAEKLLKILSQPPTEQNERLRQRVAAALTIAAEESQLPQVEAAWQREQQAAEKGNLGAIGVEMALESVVSTIKLEPPKY